MVFQGSSVTGFNSQTGAPFDSVRRSDFDIALAGPSLMQAARAAGIGLRSQGTRTEPLGGPRLANLPILRSLGLFDLWEQLTAEAGRPVAFMIFESLDGALARGPSTVVPQ